MTANTEIHTRALLVWLTISTWSARRYDKQVTRKVNADFHASDDAGRYNKMLLPGDAPSYKALTNLAGAIRAQHYANTLAWADEGWRLLPTANYMDYTQWFRDRQREFNAARDQFVRDYPMLKQSAQLRLNGLYRDEDYPRVGEIVSKFDLGVQYAPIPMQGDIRVNLAQNAIEAIELTIEHRIKEATTIAVSDAWKRLYDSVGHIVERLSQPDAIFRDTLITNAREICDSLRRLNVTDDSDLEDMRRRVEHDLTTYDPESLRQQPELRDSVATKAQSILDQMRDVYGVEQVA